MIAGLVLRRRVWRLPAARLGLALSAVGLILALGSYAGMHRILPHIPGLRWLSAPNRALVLLAVGLALLGGVAVDRLTRRNAVRLAAGAVVLAIAMVALAWRTIGRAQPGVPVLPDLLAWLKVWLVAPTAVVPQLQVPLDSAVSLAALAAALLLAGRRPRVARAVMLTLSVAQLLHFAPRVWPPLREGDLSTWRRPPGHPRTRPA